MDATLDQTTMILRAIFFATVFTILGCVSVNLGPDNTAKRAVGVKVTDPTAPFSREARTDVDGAWKNGKTGNLISYLTDCQDSTDPSLDSIVQGAVMGLSDLKIESSDSPTIQGRESRHVIASGKVDGVPSKIDLLAFKRNHCIYILSYVGVQKAFDLDHSQFGKFIQDFRAP